MKDLLDLITEDLHQGVQKVTSGEANDYTFTHIAPDTIISYFEELGGAHVEDSFDTNGWQWDWWDKVSLNGVTYSISGSGYYGGTTLSKEETED